MFSFDFDYNLINILLLWVMYIVGKKIAKGYPYWKYAKWCIIAFTLVEGARYGRGVDYLHYIDVYNYDMEESQVLFTLINRTLKLLGVSAIYAFGFYAVPFIIGGARLLEKMKPYAAYTFPLFLICYISFHEAFIRQALATSFYFLFLVKLFEAFERYEYDGFSLKSVYPLLFLAICAILIHSIQIVAIFVVLVVVVFLRKPFHWMYTIPLLLIGKFVIAENYDWSYLNVLFNLFSGEEKLAGYADHADIWFSDEAKQDEYTRNAIIQNLEVFGNCSLLYLGYKACLYVQKLKDSTKQTFKESSINIYVAIFNIVVIGVIIYQTFYNLEIVRRVAYCWYLLWFVPVSLVLYYANKTKLYTKLEKFLVLGFFFWIWEYIRFLLVFSEERMFIWDI